MSEITESKIFAKIVKAIPSSKTENKFDEYSACEMAIAILDKAREYYFNKSEELLAEIVANNVKDDTREVVFKAEYKRSVDMKRLSDNSELFEKLTFIKEADVARIVGRQELKRIAFETAGEEKCKSMLTCNIGDLENELGKKEALEYIKSETTRSQTPIVVGINSYQADHYKCGSENITEVLITDTDVTVPKAISHLKL